MFSPARVIHTVEGIRGIEAPHLHSAHPSLMERAGAAAAALALDLLRGPGPVLVACGPGNNGGDGLVLARLLAERGLSVSVVLAGSPARLPPDAHAAYLAWRARGGECLEQLPEGLACGCSLVVDALFGIGLQRDLSAPWCQLIERLSSISTARLALDLPSGLDATTGAVRGTAFRATHTITFIGLKPGLLTADGPDHCGVLSVADLGLPNERSPGSGRQLSPSLFREHLRARRLNSHKGTYGDVVVLGGARGMVGAALLAGRAALHIGAGRVFVGLLDSSIPAIDPGQPELMVRSVAGLAQAPAPAALAVGPGLGRGPEALGALRQALEGKSPLVLDADALHLLAEDGALSTLVSTRGAPAVLTPHPAEAAHLLGCSTAEVQADRLAATLALAQRFGCPALLKGCGSVVALPDRNWFINSSGHPGMATAGMGDSLSGLIAGLIAQGWPAGDALIAAVHLHGKAADLLASEGCGPIGLTAGEIAGAARRVFNQWISAR